MNIIFLDIDGVLNSMPYFESVRQKRIELNNEIDESKLVILQQIVHENNAKIVLSSTWRDLEEPSNSSCYEMWNYLIKSLAKYGMDLYSKTPYYHNDRPAEIKMWLDERPDKDNINYIILDDDYDEEVFSLLGLGGHLIHTCFFAKDAESGGLQKEHIDIAKDLFELQNKNSHK